MTNQIMIDAVRYGHLFAVAVGLGSAFVADHAALSRLRGGITPQMLATLRNCHRLIWPALAAMWLTGLVLVGIRTGYDLSAFSPKLMAKLLVVAILTLNALLIGRFAMPALEAHEGRDLAALPAATFAGAAMVSGVSTASWLIALALGSSKVLAAAPAPIFVALLPAIYAAALIGGLGAVALLRLRGAPVPA